MPDLLEDEYRDVYNTWKNDPSPKNNQHLIGVVEPVIDSAITSYAQGAASPSLKTKAKLMALDAVRKYDPARAKLKTHLLTQLQGIRRVAGQEKNLVHIPEQLLLNQNTLHRAQKELYDQIHREPSDAELADYTGLSIKKINKVRSLPIVHTEGASAVDGEGDPVSPGVVDNDPTAWNDFVYVGLHPTDQFIMQHTLGLYGNPKLSTGEIAKRLRITPGAVSQKASRIQAQLDARDEVNLL